MYYHTNKNKFYSLCTTLNSVILKIHLIIQFSTIKFHKIPSYNIFLIAIRLSEYLNHPYTIELPYIDKNILACNKSIQWLYFMKYLFSMTLNILLQQCWCCSLSSVLYISFYILFMGAKIKFISQRSLDAVFLHAKCIIWAYP